jgi:hypothetical protein
MTKYREVLPAGLLKTQGETYYLLSPHPIIGDSWEGDNCYRFVCVPTDYYHYNNERVYNYARHVVTNCFSIEYVVYQNPIKIEVLDEYDISETENLNVEEEFVYDQ